MAKNKYETFADDLDLIANPESPVLEEKKEEVPEATFVGTDGLAVNPIPMDPLNYQSPDMIPEPGVETVTPGNYVFGGESPLPEDVVVKEEVTNFITGMIAATDALEANMIKEAAGTPTIEIKKEKTMSNFYVPKNIKAEKALTKEVIKKVDSLNLEEVLKLELSGKGKSEISGLIDVHVQAETFKDVIITLIKTVKDKVQIENKAIFDNFIAGIVGISAQLSYDMTGAPLTVANFHKAATDKIMNEVPNTNVQVASAKAADLVTAYVGKSVTELKGAATALPVKLLTLVVRRNAIPSINGKDDKIGIDLICNSFTSEYVKSVIADGDFVHIGLNLSKLFKFTQGHFTVKDLETTTMVSATILANSASVNSVVYRVEKK